MHWSPRLCETILESFTKGKPLKVVVMAPVVIGSLVLLLRTTFILIRDTVHLPKK